MRRAGKTSGEIELKKLKLHYWPVFNTAADDDGVGGDAQVDYYNDQDGRWYRCVFTLRENNTPKNQKKNF